MRSLRLPWTQLLKVLVGLAGAYLFLRLVLSVGWSVILGTFRSHTFALAFLTAIYTAYHVLRTWTLRICIPHRVHFAGLFGVRLAGEAVAYVAVGSVVGDALKVVLARDRIPVVEGATGVFAEKLIYHLAGAGFIIGGLFVGVLRFGATKLLVYGLSLMSLLFLGFLFLLSSGAHPIARILSGIRVRYPKVRQAVLQTEESLFQFRKDHPKEFFFTFLLNLASYFYSVAEVLVVYYVIGIRVSLWDLCYYQAVVKMSNAATMIIPANLGVFEATNVLLANQLGLGNQAGMIAALFIRIRAMLWSLLGYLWFLHLIGKQKDPED